MKFEIGWVFAEVQILKKSETISKSHVSHEIVKWNLRLVEALPSAKFWKSENGIISWTEWNSLIDFCVKIDIDKI